jgi:hypothetical protein
VITIDRNSHLSADTLERGVAALSISSGRHCREFPAHQAGRDEKLQHRVGERSTQFGRQLHRRPPGAVMVPVGRQMDRRSVRDVASLHAQYGKGHAGDLHLDIDECEKRLAGDAAGVGDHERHKGGVRSGVSAF